MEKTVMHRSSDGGEHSLSLNFTKYHNGQTSITLYDNADGMPYAHATVCVEDELLKDGEVAIDNSLEMAGILDSLIDAKVIDFPHAFIQSELGRLPVCRIIMLDNQ